jgi:hypothetical protein
MLTLLETLRITSPFPLPTTLLSLYRADNTTLNNLHTVKVLTFPGGNKDYSLSIV